MDIGLTEEQQAVQSLAAEIPRTTTSHRSRCAPSRTRIRRALTARCGRSSGLLGIFVPQEHGGQGRPRRGGVAADRRPGAGWHPCNWRRTSPVRCSRWSVTATRRPRCSPRQHVATRCSATPDTVDDGDAGRRRLVLDGVKTCLPASLYADAFVVSASTPMGGAPILSMWRLRVWTGTGRTRFPTPPRRL
jgi:alkylation response protein AidB-like acyl-CoA dehydrogenase